MHDGGVLNGDMGDDVAGSGGVRSDVGVDVANDDGVGDSGVPSQNGNATLVTQTNDRMLVDLVSEDVNVVSVSDSDADVAPICGFSSCCS